MEYKLIRSKRKTLSLEIDERCELVVRAPMFLSTKKIEQFIDEKQNWIEKSIQRMYQKQQNKKVYSEQEIKELYKKGRELLAERLPYFAQKVGVKPTGVKITGAKKRFGSCSAKNSLCFSVYLFSYPADAIDYVIVHELCHIKEHTHSVRFWREVEQVLPDYKLREKMLKSQSQTP